MNPSNPPDFNDPAYWDKTVATYEAVSQPFTGQFAEAAVAALNLRPGVRVLDIATGTGAAALAAIRTGAQVLAVDFSAGMVEKVLSYRLPGLDAKQMNGQALDLPDAQFDAAISVFGVMLFSDWRAGLREMARVTKPGGAVAVATWADPCGAALHLLMAQVCRQLYPEVSMPPIGGVSELSDAQRLDSELQHAGFIDPKIEPFTRDFLWHLSALEQPGQLFTLSPLWHALDSDQRAAVLAGIRERAERERRGDFLPIPSTALIATARRP